MPPLPSQKGTGKKGRDVRQSRSRNTTPNLGANTTPVLQADATAYLELPIKHFHIATPDDVVEQNGSAIPSSKDLEALMERLQRLMTIVEERGLVCDRGMRMLAQARKDMHEEIETERRDEERREILKRDALDEEERDRNKANKLKKRRDGKTKEERPLTHGAHGLAPQDGTNLGMLTISKIVNIVSSGKRSGQFNSGVDPADLVLGLIVF